MMITDSFNNYMRKYFDAEVGAYTAATQTEIEKNTFYVKAVIRHMLEERLGKRNIPHAQNIGKQHIEFKICKKTIGVHEEIKKIPCKYSKPDKDEMTIYFSSGIIEEFNMKAGDIWYVYFKTNDPVPWLGIISKSKWRNLFDSLDDTENDTQNDTQKVQIAFKPRAQILLQLGEQLIKNESIAILELVKNAYDADAKKVTVTMIDVDLPESGYIEIVDNGCGMDIDIIRNIWMEPGNNHKKKVVEENNRSDLGRLPLGEKGIGRFGVHKLGKVIELTSRKKNRKEVYIKINWNLFESAQYLEDVEIEIYERDPEVFTEDKTGTFIHVEQLSTEWTRGMMRSLQRSLTALNSPFDSDVSFKVSPIKTNHKEWLEGLLKFNDIKEYALFECDMELEKNELNKFEYKFMPYDMMHNLKKRKVVFSEPIIMRKKVSQGRKNEFQDIDLSDYHIGRIRMKLYAFDRDSSTLSNYIKDKVSFKSYLDENGGISVFRDGMRVLDYGEPDNDWLGLDIKRVNAPTRTLSNNIILGAVYLDRKDSGDLKEKANREGFIEDDAYKCFKSAVEFALGQFTAQRNIDKESLRVSLDSGAKEPVKTEISEVRNILLKANIDINIKVQLESSLAKMERELEFLKQRYLKTANAGMSYGIVIHEIEKIIHELKIAVKEESTSKKIQMLSSHLSRLIDSYAELLRNKSKTNTSLVEIINQALFSIQYRLDAHHIEIVDRYSNQVNNDYIKCASNMIVGAIINIIDNSIYWTTYAKKPKRKVLIKISDEINGLLSIIIADNGTGFRISGEDAIKPFVSTKTDGIGLGLNIVNEIMLSQQGLLMFPDVGDVDLPDEFKYGAVIALSFKKE
jgi:signal transduction histidine kinase/anti-sigma regulatory factor (Ser/Thr protein kinase)